MLKSLIFISLFALANLVCSAQDFNNIIPPSPDAYSLGKYADIPVSLYTGVPDITIPLYELKGRKISMPITLSYHAAGFKVDEIASWVGLGWTLNAGGVITRSVRGLPDEETTYGYFYSQSFDSCFQNCDNFYAYAPDEDFLRDVSDGVYDTEPDIFSYNFNGYSGTFYFNGSGDFNDPVVLVPHRQLDVITDYGFEEWIIKVEDGTKYIFGTNDAIEITHTSGGCGLGTLNPNFVSSWYLRYIISPNNEDTISFTYSEESYSYSLQKGEELLYDLYPETLLDANSCSRGISLSGQRLSTIESVNTKITFDTIQSRDDLPGYPRLKNMTICSCNGTDILKQYIFCTSYFGSGYGSGSSKRLKLTGLREVHSSDTSYKYDFIYNTQELPNRLSKQQDHWGYYNGATGNDGINSLIPTMVFGSVTIDGANREPNTTKTKARILTKIIYPTRGYTEFEYEAHDYGYVGAVGPTTENEFAGGCRIKKITDYDGISHDNDIIRKFIYRLQSDPEISSGVLLHRPKYFQYMDLDDGSVGPAPDYSTTYVKIFASSTVPLTSIQGGHIGYREVEVIYGNNGENGRERVKFKSSLENPDQYPASYTFPIPLNESYDWKRGLETERLTLNEDLNSVQKINYSYNSIDESRNRNILRLFNCMYAWRGTFIHNDIEYTTDQARFIYGSAKVISAWNYMNSQTKTEYFPEGNVQVSTQFSYQNSSHSQLTKVKTSTSINDEEQITYYKYPHDIVNWISTTVKQRMIYRNMVNTVLEQETYRKNQPYDSTLLSGERRFYSFDIFINNDTLINLDSIQLNHKEDASPYITRLFYDSIDSYGNLLQHHKSDDYNISYIWGYNNTLPIAKVENANYNEIYYNSFEEEDSFVGDYHSGKYYNRLNPGAYAGVVDFPMNALNTTGKYVYSAWFKTDGSAILIVKDRNDQNPWKSKNVTNTNGQWKYFEIIVDLSSSEFLGCQDIRCEIYNNGTTYTSVDDVRFHPVDAQMITFAYDPIKGVISKSDSNGQPIHYEYDDFGRLYLIRDPDKNVLKRYTYHFKE